MTTPRTSSRAEPPVTMEGVPGEEGVSRADAARRVDLDPAEQPNRADPVSAPESETDPEPQAEAGPEFPEGDRS